MIIMYVQVDNKLFGRSFAGNVVIRLENLPLRSLIFRFFSLLDFHSYLSAHLLQGAGIM